MASCRVGGHRKLRVLDEPTACIFGYHGAARQDERFVVFDFGGGTLDVSAVRLDLQEQTGRKAVQFGQAGCDLGGMDLDKWIFDDFCARHDVSETDRRDLENLILRHAESVKVSLSDPATTEAELSLLNDLGRAPRLLQTTYRRSCPDCERGRVRGLMPPAKPALAASSRKGFLTQIREAIDRALENAAMKSMRRSDLTRVLVTGGTSLVPAVRGSAG